MWLAGFSASEIAMFTSSSRKAALGIAQKGPFPARASMTLAERQQALNELLAARHDEDGKLIDGGLLPDRIFTAKELRKAQSKT